MSAATQFLHHVIPGDESDFATINRLYSTLNFTGPSRVYVLVSLWIKTANQRGRDLCTFRLGQRQCALENFLRLSSHSVSPVNQT